MTPQHHPATGRAGERKEGRKHERMRIREAMGSSFSLVEREW